MPTLTIFHAKYYGLGKGEGMAALEKIEERTGERKKDEIGSLTE